MNPGKKNIWRGKKIHFVGIKGTGVSGLAQFLLNQGASINGSDVDQVFLTDATLKASGIEVRNFNDQNITKDLDLVIYSTAYTSEHPERKRATELNIPQLSYAEALSRFANAKKTIVITGTHGKTTTTAIIGTIFEKAGLDPSVLVGDRVKNWDNSIRIGSGEYFIVEGDEYQEKFRMFHPVAIVIPSLDYDHPDYFKSPSDYLESFRGFIKENPNAIFVTTEEVKDMLVTTTLTPEDIDQDILEESNFILPGEKYRENCTLAIRLARALSISDEFIIKGINSFQGVDRRLDFYTKTSNGMQIIYDYAHHPEEIKATLEALYEIYQERSIIAVFQPHTFSRTKTFLKEFAASFDRAKMVFFDEIYASARETSGEVTIEDLIKETKIVHKKVYRFKDFSREAFLRLLQNESQPIVLFMGAGNINEKARSLAKSLRR